MYNFSIIMAVLVGVVYLVVLISIWKLSNNKIVALLGFMSIMFFNGLFPIIYHNGNQYLQYLPRRMIFPAIFILICTIFVCLKTINYKQMVKILGYIISCLSILWNIDTGIIVIAAWCVFLIFIELLEYSFKDRKLYINILKYLSI